LAVLRLITKSNFVDCWTGKSAAFSPLRMRPAIRARHRSREFYVGPLARQSVPDGSTRTASSLMNSRLFD
jgi:hypothetical protein